MTSFAAVSLITVVAIGVAWVLTRPLGSSTPDPSADAGASFYRIGAEVSGLGIGQLAPELAGTDGSVPVTLTDLRGGPVSLAALRGEPVWVVFWATWCPPCQAETPDLQRAYEANAAAGLNLIAVDVQEPAEAVQGYVDLYGLTYTVALDPSAAVMRAWGVFGLPTHYFIGRDGVVRDRVYGPLTLDKMNERVAAIMSP